MERRVKFSKGEQKLFIQKAAKNFGSIKNLSEKINIPYSTLKKYTYELLLMPENLYLKVISVSNLNKKEINVQYLPPNWGKSNAGKNGMKALELKYPKKIDEWRGKGVRRFVISNLKEIKKINIDEKMAEFFGVYLGDGTLTKYFIRIAGDSRYDLPYFNYLNILVGDIFGLVGSITKNKVTNNLYFTLYSKKVCDFFNKELGIKYGDKLRNNTLIPFIFLKNEILYLACLRGLVDTDGCISMRGDSFSVSFYSKNPNLINQIRQMEENQRIFSYISKNIDEIGTNSKDKVINYFKKVGSSNLRHIVRFYEKFIFNNSVYQNEVTNHYQKDLYRDINLPFKLMGPIG
jgi:hypothetical protein